jgi:hypothetical protein
LFQIQRSKVFAKKMEITIAYTEAGARLGYAPEIFRHLSESRRSLPTYHQRWLFLSWLEFMREKIEEKFTIVNDDADDYDELQTETMKQMTEDALDQIDEAFDKFEDFIAGDSAGHLYNYGCLLRIPATAGIIKFTQKTVRTYLAKLETMKVDEDCRYKTAWDAAYHYLSSELNDPLPPTPPLKLVAGGFSRKICREEFERLNC